MDSINEGFICEREDGGVAERGAFFVVSSKCPMFG